MTANKNVWKIKEYIPDFVVTALAAVVFVGACKKDPPPPPEPTPFTDRLRAAGLGGFVETEQLRSDIAAAARSAMATRDKKEGN